MTFFKWPVCYAYEKFHFQSFQNRNLSQKIENFNSTYQTTVAIGMASKSCLFFRFVLLGAHSLLAEPSNPSSVIFRAALAASHADSSSKEHNYSTRVVTSTKR